MVRGAELARTDAVSNYDKPVYIQTLINEGQLESPEFGLHLQRARDLGAPLLADNGEATIQSGEVRRAQFVEDTAQLIKAL